MKREIEICLGIRWSDPDFAKTASATEYLLQSLDNSFYRRDLPVHWLIPPCPFLECRHKELNNIILEIRTRMKTLKDIPVAAGYTGTCLPLLSYDEMEKEISWTITNPWKSGLKDQFEVVPEILIPGITVSVEKDNINLYLDNGFKYIGVNTLFPPVYDNTENNISFFCYHDLYSFSSLSALKKRIKWLLQKKILNLFFILDISPELNDNTLKSMWQNFIKIPDWLAKQYTVAFTTLNKSGTVNRHSHGDCFSRPFSLENSPGLRNKLLTADQYKIKKDKKQEDYRSLLIALSNSHLPEEKKPEAGKNEKGSREIFPPADRISDCTMQGNTILAGSDFAGNFHNGKLYNLQDKQEKNLLAGEMARSYIKILKKEYQFQNLSSFSVGGEYTRGLRESLKIEIPEQIHEGTQITEYIFIDDFPYLIVSSRIKYPVLDLGTIITAIAPFEIPLFYIDKAIQILALTPGSTRTYTLDPAHDLYTIPANLVSIPGETGNNILFGFPPEKNSTLGIMEFKIKRCKKQHLLVINLFGTYSPLAAKQFNKTTEIFSFYIGVSPVIPEKIPYFPAKILKEIPEQIIHID